ncbi:hypothetical protein LguiB_025194 [Lonicera macranthoides]
MEKLKNQEDITSITQLIFYLFIKTNSIFFFFSLYNQTELKYNKNQRRGPDVTRPGRHRLVGDLVNVFVQDINTSRSSRYILCKNPQTS